MQVIGNYKQVSLSDVDFNEISRITVITGKDCNFSCEHCCIQNPEYGLAQAYRYDLKFNGANIRATMQKVLAEAKKVEVRRFIYNDYIGGEPLIHFAELKDTIQDVVNSGLPIKPHFFTNGYLLDDEKLKFIQENRMATLLSFDGFLSSRKIVKIGDADNRMRELLETLPNKKKVSIRVVISEVNIDTISDVLIWLHSLGYEYLHINAVEAGVKDIPIFIEKLARVFKTCKELAKFGAKFNLWMKPARMGQVLNILADGTLMLSDDVLRYDFPHRQLLNSYVGYLGKMFNPNKKFNEMEFYA